MKREKTIETKEVVEQKSQSQLAPCDFGHCIPHHITVKSHNPVINNRGYVSASMSLV